MLKLGEVILFTWSELGDLLDQVSVVADSGQTTSLTKEEDQMSEDGSMTSQVHHSSYVSSECERGAGTRWDQ